ncbi:methyltransferase domain-containing protein [Geodermatophilus sabuli]|uniref:Methyltransferase domain-containing protein n=1 Tax=Geodermatophilus sabuli TaxID=1564158 RepID=A0A285E8W5_9ACTN|nr:methyltransferase domain-containing protein [Geodermatophilus sabuli]MBB3085023.1 SAM-dependent methyltransferase [Geodermatophilus sabuli]SNX95569.1 Methyltransferase domain-containing protein [Geodermatophilus sabuli]
MTAVQRWRDELAAWAIDPAVLAAAPESPYGFPPGLFGSDRRPGRTVDAAREVAPSSVLDVGCGGGAASIPVGAPELLAVDSSEEMLERYRAAAGSTPVRTWCGRWPDVAEEVPPADVVVAADVAYNVPDVEAFVAALTAHARRRVVVELGDVHPWTSMGALWRHFHGQDRPAGPSAAQFGAVLAELGIAAESATEPRPDPWQDAPADVVLAFTRRRLCLPVDREPEVAEAMRRFRDDRPRTSTTYWWVGTAS